MTTEEVIDKITNKIEEYIKQNFAEIKVNSGKTKEVILKIIETELKNNDL